MKSYATPVSRDFEPYIIDDWYEGDDASAMGKCVNVEYCVAASLHYEGARN